MPDNQSNPFFNDLASHSTATYREITQMKRAGFGPEIGVATAAQSAGFGQAFQSLGGGGLTSAQARQLDQELRLSAAKSPMANMLGAAMAMSEAGMFQGNGPLSALSGNDPTKRQQMLTQLAHLNPAQFVDTMRKAGVDPATSAKFLGAQKDNREQIARHGIQDIVRMGQGQEIHAMMIGVMTDAFSGGLKQSGVHNSKERRALAMGAGQALQAEMVAMAGEKLTPEQRDQRLAAAAQRALPGVDQKTVQQLTAGAVHSMEEQVRADPNLQRFGNVQGLLDMNRADILKQGMANASATKAATQKNKEVAASAITVPKPTKNELRIMELRKKLGIEKLDPEIYENLINNTMEDKAAATELVRLNQDQRTAKEAQTKADGQGHSPPGANGQNSNPQRIHITGTLTINADGSAVIDTDSGVPVN